MYIVREVVTRLRLTPNACVLPLPPRGVNCQNRLPVYTSFTCYCCIYHTTVLVTIPDT